jgi:hexosaminidase
MRSVQEALQKGVAFAILFLFLSACFLSGCSSQPAPRADVPYPIVPKPKLLEPLQGSFTVTNDTPIWVSGSDADSLDQIAVYISDWLEEIRDIELDLYAEGKGIQLILDPAVEGEEAYSLDIGAAGIELRASTARGLFYASQSLLQLMPVSGLSSEIDLPAVHIEDEPRFAYRGLMLDVGRHFFPVDFIKKYIDLLAHYKLNRFHWHLTEDQGWRIEIKRYPKLQEVAAYRPETLIGHYNDQPQRYDGKRRFARSLRMPRSVL